MIQSFDLIVIGTGSAASTVAHHCRDAGWRVAIVDSRPFGGTCALRGCDPKRLLIGVAEALDQSRRMTGTGIDATLLKLDWSSLMRYKRTFTEPVPARRESEFAKAGIAAFHGRAHFSGTNTVSIGEEKLEARRIVIATGAVPATLEISGSEHLTTSDQFLELETLPKRILFIGGGYIAFEFAHLAALAGSQVTLLHKDSRPLPRFDPDLVDQLVKYTRELGVHVHLDTEATSIQPASESSSALLVRGSHFSDTVEFQADMVVHAAGRVPELDELNLATAGIDRQARGVTVNKFLQSVSNPSVYAAGDAAATGGPPLTPIASYEGRLVAANLLKGNHETANYLGVPSVVFTIPQLASVGLGETAANEQGLHFRTKHENTSDSPASRRLGETVSGYKLLVEAETDRILGAHVLGREAAEVINLFAVAIRSGLPATSLRHTLFAYPTRSSSILRML